MEVTFKKTITISFKSTIEDKELYEWIVNHSNLSGFIKDTLRKEMKKENSNFSNEKTEFNNSNSNELIELGDF